MKKLLTTTSAIALAVGLFAAAPAGATSMYTSESAWDVATAFHVGTVVVTPTVNGATVASIVLAGGSSLDNFSSPPVTHIVGTSWATWQGQPGSNGTTVYNAPASNVMADFHPGSIFGLGTFHAVDAFGFYVEPDAFVTDTITLGLSDGSSLSQDVNGNGGASFFGWVGGGVTSITISSTGGDFAFGDFAEGSTQVPEPAGVALLGVGLLGLGLIRRQRA